MFGQSKPYATNTIDAEEVLSTSHVQSMIDEHMQQLFLASSSTSSTATSPSTQGSAMTMFGALGNATPVWIFYYGASYHMTCDSSLLHSCHPPSRNLNIHTAEDTLLPVITIDSISTKHLSLSTILCVPNLSLNLISVSQLTSSGYLVSFTSTNCSVQDTRTGK